MKISIVTATYNSAATIEDTLQSVLAQTYEDIEYIIVDGCSSDDTLGIVRRYAEQFNGRLKVISERDKGLYDAMNKGLHLATGDIVGILNSDDYFTSPDVVATLVAPFVDATISAVYGDVHFVREGAPDKCVRYYSSKKFKPSWLRYGMMPAHPSFYMRKSVFEKVGPYRLDYAIGADYEMMVRFFIRHRLKAVYINKDFVTMRLGGLSTNGLSSKLQLIKDDVRACRENGVYTNSFLVSLKFFYKVFELRW